MRRVFALTLLALGACATHAPDPFEIYFRNTVLVTQPYGEVSRLLLSPDHSYVMYGVRYPEVRGAWSVDGGRVCLQTNNAGESQSSCDRWPGRRVGDQWLASIDGEQVSMRLAANRLGPVPTASFTNTPVRH